MIDKEKILFPYSKVREVQEDMINEVLDSIENGGNAIIHAPTGLGKCVSGNTLILTDEGLKNISDLYLKGVEVNGISNDLTVGMGHGIVIKKKKSVLYKVKTQTGREVYVTTDHKFLTIRKGKIEWIPLMHLEVGDYISCSRRLYLRDMQKKITVEQLSRLDGGIKKKIKVATNPSLIKIIRSIKDKKGVGCVRLAKEVGCTKKEIVSCRKGHPIKLGYLLKILEINRMNPAKVGVTRVRYKNSKEIDVPKLNEDFAYFFGILMGDGHIQNNPRKTIILSNTNKGILDFFNRFAKKFDSQVYKLCGSNCDYAFNNKSLVAVLYSLSYPKEKKSEKALIPNIFFSHKKLLSSFLSGLYDTDGSVYDSTTIEFSTKSKKLKDCVLNALLCFGIYPIVKDKMINGNKYYRIYTCDTENNKKFFECIGFRHAEKREKLKLIINKISNTNVDIIPEIGRVIRECKRKLKVRYSRDHMHRIYESYAYGLRNPSRNGLRKLIGYFKGKSKINSRELRLLKKLAYSDLFWDKIIEIKKGRKYYVYDATIPSLGNFIGNGVVLHNTVAVLGPALSIAMKKGLSIFFLTSRHTQHHLAVNTLKDIKEKHNTDFISCDIIGKQHMCALDEVDKLYANEFRDYCKKLRDDNACEFYSNTKKKSGRATLKALSVLEELKELSPMHVEKVVELCVREKLCPYEMSTLLAKNAQIIIGDYYYIFNPDIRNTFFNKSGKELEKSVIIVDEAHNLPKRCRELLSWNLSNFILSRAIKEAGKFKFDNVREKLYDVMDILEELSSELDEKKEEKIVKKDEFIDKIEEYDNAISEFSFAADEIREKQKRSYVGGVGNFLEAWTGQDNGFARILGKKIGAREPYVNLMYKCLDPSFITKDVINDSYSIIGMSGTLTPTFMYKDILGFNDVKERVFNSPFPKKNKLSLIVPETTTKFIRRKEEEFKKIAKVCSEIVNLVPGNSLVFFPSYLLRDKIYFYFSELCKKEIFIEKPRLSKEEKHLLLEEFKSYKDSGACLLCVTAGSFGEGIDLPGDFLKGVIVVGLPLEKPSLEVRELIDYYDLRYGRGWEYGYIFPAMIKTMQNAGRCIRSENDKGVVVFLDERYAYPQYYNCFPPDYGVRISKMYKEKIKDFFEKKDSD